MSAAAAAEGTRARVEEALEGIEHETSTSADGILIVRVERGQLFEALQRLKERARFAAVTFVTAIDRLPAEPRFEVAFQLWAVETGDRVRVKVHLAADAPSCASCTPLWPGASFFERECYDLFGIVFEDHPDLRRLMMPEDYGHHPLRKDFPHQGIEPDRLYRRWDEARRKQWREQGKQG